MKVTIGIIVSHGFPVPAVFLDSWTRMLRGILTGVVNQQVDASSRIESARVMFSYAFPIDGARNELCRLFLDEDDGDYLLFLDTDMRHPEDAAHRLVGHGLDVVSGRYVMRKPPFFTVAMRKTGPGVNEYQALEKLEPTLQGLMPIDAGGAGILLIRRRVLRAIREDNVKNGQPQDEWFRYKMAEDGLRTVSEDMWFYERARACGFQPYLDTGCACKHVAHFEVDHTFHTPYAEAHAKATSKVAPDLSEARYTGEAQAVAEGSDLEEGVFVTSKDE